MTLINVLVGLSLGSIILLGAVQGYYHSRITLHQQQKLFRQFDAGSMALQYLTRDIQASGYRGCRSNDSVFPLYRWDSEFHAAYPLLRFDRAVSGFLATPGVCYGKLPGSSCKRLKMNSAVLILYNIPQPAQRLKKPLIDTRGPIETPKKPDVRKDAVVLISDCERAEIFIANRLGKNQIFHEKIIGVNQSEHFSKPYGVEAEVLELQTVAYYVGIPERFNQKKSSRQSVSYSLFRDDFIHQAIEIVTQVESLEIKYGLLHPETGKLQYRTAGELKDNDWDFVQSIQITLVAEKNHSWKYEIALRNRIRPYFPGDLSDIGLSYCDAFGFTRPITL